MGNDVDIDGDGEVEEDVEGDEDEMMNEEDIDIMGGDEDENDEDEEGDEDDDEDDNLDDLEVVESVSLEDDEDNLNSFANSISRTANSIAMNREAISDMSAAGLEARLAIRRDASRFLSNNQHETSNDHQLVDSNFADDDELDNNIEMEEELYADEDDENEFRDIDEGFDPVYEDSWTNDRLNSRGTVGRDSRSRRGARGQDIASISDILSGSGIMGMGSGAVRVRIDGANMPQMLQIMDAVQRQSGAPGGHVHSHAPTGDDAGFNSFQQLVQSMIPISMNSNRAGSVTLSFGSSTNPLATIPGVTSTTTQQQLSQPPSHPLLYTTDYSRRGEMRVGQTSFGGLQSRMPSMRETPNLLYDNNRLNKSNISQRRRSLGPIVSDRRWGTDVGELESVGSRFQALYSSVESSISKSITNIDNEIENKVKKNSFADISSEPSGKMFYENEEDSDYYIEESKEEGILQETKDDDDRMHRRSTRRIPEVSSTVPAIYDSRDNLLENIQFTGQSEDVVAGSEFVFREPSVNVNTLATSETNRNESSTINTTSQDNVLGSQPQVDILPAPINVTENILVQIENSLYSSAVNEVENNNMVNTNAVVYSEENIAFISSLPDDLREEVLLTSEDSFLNTLSPEYQDEANQLRERRAIEIAMYGMTGSINTINNYLSSIVPALTEQSTSVVGTTQSNVVNNPVDPSALTVTSPNPPQPVNADISSAQSIEKQSLKVDEEAMFVVLKDDREDVDLPYDALLISRLIRCLFSSKKTKISKAVLRSLATACRYKNGRISILNVLFSSFHKNTVDMVRNIRSISRVDLGKKQDDLLSMELKQLSEEIVSSPLSTRKVMSILSYLVRKTDKLVWYDLLMKRSVDWLFVSLLKLLREPSNITSINLEYILVVIEEICSPLSHLSVPQANRLVQLQLENDNKSTDLSNESSQINEQPAKKARFENNTTSSTKFTKMEPIQEEVLDGIVKKERKVYLPFVVVQESDSKLLCDIAGRVECGGATRKRLTRVMRNLSLADHNWHLFLHDLSNVAINLTTKTSLEFSDIYNKLVNTIQSQGNHYNFIGKHLMKYNGTKGDVNHAMSLHQIASPTYLPELGLLNILRQMTILRARSNASALAESEIVSSYIRRIEAESLWESLCECLDIVRELEGIIDLVDVSMDQEVITNKNI